MKNKNITLPYELATKDLTLQEIGTIFTIFAIQRMNYREASKWSTNGEYLETVDDLLTKEFIKVSFDEDENMSIDIDLTDKEPKPFWDIYDHDDDGNPIYWHPSHYYDEGYPFLYKIKPILRDMKVVWVDCSDAELLVNSIHQFSSLEEAEEYYTELLNFKLEQIESDL